MWGTHLSEPDTKAEIKSEVEAAAPSTATGASAAAGGSAAAAQEETFERDATQLLGAFQDEPVDATEEPVDAEELMKQFLLEMKDVDRSNEVVRVLSAFKLNPFEKLGLRFTATASDVKKAYRCVPAGAACPCQWCSSWK